MKYHCIFFFLLLSYGSFAQEPDPFKIKEPEKANYPEPKSASKIKMEEVYFPDGTYKKTDRDLIITGYHINKVLHGKFTEKTITHTISKTYDHGNLVGYQNAIRTHDNNPPNEQEYWKKGPYFAGSKPKGFFTVANYDRNVFLNERYMLLLEDTLFFSPNTDIEIHRHASIKGESKVTMEPGTFVYRIYNTKKTAYTNEDIESALKTKTIESKHFLSNQFNPDGEVIQYNNKGKRVAESYPDYRLTYHPNGTVQDSILRSATSYQHYRFDTNKKVVFKSQTESIPETDKIRVIYTYFKNSNPIYTISFIEGRYFKRKPEKITSSNDSINQVIRNGLIRDYDGTVYITQADGKIDTSFSKEVYPYRYQTKLKNGNYYFLPSALNTVVYVLSVTDSIIVGYTTKTQELDGKKWNHYSANQVMQNGNRYQLSEYHQPGNAVKIVVTNGKVYSSGWFDKRLKGPYEQLKTNVSYSLDQMNNWNNFPYDLNDYAADFAADTLFSFTTQMLTEDELKKALNSTHITKMPRDKFDGMIHELKKVREQEKNALSKLNPDGKKGIHIDSKQLCQLVYNLGYNPYFLEDEMIQLMTDLKLTAEEQEPLKQLMFVNSYRK